jgi:hypothetical protein
MHEQTVRMLSLLNDCVQHRGFTQLLSLEIQNKLNDSDRDIIGSELKELVSPSNKL